MLRTSTYKPIRDFIPSFFVCSKNMKYMSHNAPSYSNFMQIYADREKSCIFVRFCVASVYN